MGFHLLIRLYVGPLVSGFLALATKGIYRENMKRAKKEIVICFVIKRYYYYYYLVLNDDGCPHTLEQ
jgi:hypothetical protein